MNWLNNIVGFGISSYTNTIVKSNPLYINNKDSNIRLHNSRN